ncbi:MAG: endo-1,4-beta-xylanase [bacterium]
MRFVKIIFTIIIVIIFFVFVLSRGHIYEKDELEYGITFSKKQAENLELDWKEIYIAVLDDLGVKKIRISAYWDEVEAQNGNYNWEDLDWQIQEADKRSVEIILAMGGRLPRWPECHFPDWYNNLNKEEKEKEVLEYIEQVILRYKNEYSIKYWQVENEPFLSHFGECPKFNKDLLDKEIKLVKSLDERDVIVTDSGELSVWILAAKRADVFGTTMYRDTYSAVLKSYIHYPITPGFFRFKKNIAKIFAHPKKWIVIELQAEPWGPMEYKFLTKEEKDKTMNLQKFKEMIEFSSQTGFKEFYLWGAEWWYWEMENGDSDLWNEAKNIF